MDEIQSIDQQIEQLERRKRDIVVQARADRERQEQAQRVALGVSIRQLIAQYNAIEAQREAVLEVLFDELVAAPGPKSVRFSNSECWGNCLRGEGRELQLNREAAMRMVFCQIVAAEGSDVALG